MHEIERAREALRAIPCPADRESWWPVVGSALAAGLPDDDIIDWCANGPGFSRRDVLSTIASLKRRPGTGQDGSLYAMARDAGWRDDRPMNGHRNPPRREHASRTRENGAQRPQFDVMAVWDACEPATPEHGYIRRKLGLADGLRVVPDTATLVVGGERVAGWLAVPMFNGSSDEPASLQLIRPEKSGDPSRDKRTAPGPMAGWFTVGGSIATGSRVFVCEGIGQAWSAHQATQSPAVVAFGLGRMETVARAVQERGARVVLVADVGTEAKIAGAAESLGCAWIAPPADLGKNGDINDLHQRDGMRAVGDLLAQAREPARPDAPKLPALKSAADLLRRDFAPIRWLIPGLLPEGLMLLAARPKVGKSWLALDVAIATATGGTVLGRKVARGDVLYLALEDSDRRMHSRLSKLQAAGEGLGDFDYATEWPRGAEGAAAIHAWIDAHPNARLVVVDVFTKLRAAAEGRETAYATDYTDVTMLKPPPDRAVSILLVHHTRKAESDDPIDSISGTLGIGGAADGAWVIKRARGADEAELHLIGRDLEEEGAFAVRFDRESCRWQWVGEAWKVRMSAERRQALDALAEQPMKPAELAAALGKSQEAARKIVHDMAKDGQIERGLDGRYRPVAPEGTF